MPLNRKPKISNERRGFPLRAVGEPDAIARTVAQLRDAGVAILCGTDAPKSGTAFDASMHEELALLVRAGAVGAHGSTQDDARSGGRAR